MGKKKKKRKSWGELGVEMNKRRDARIAQFDIFAVLTRKPRHLGRCGGPDPLESWKIAGKSGCIHPLPGLGSKIEKSSSNASKDNAICKLVSVHKREPNYEEEKEKEKEKEDDLEGAGNLGQQVSRL